MWRRAEPRAAIAALVLLLACTASAGVPAGDAAGNGAPSGEWVTPRSALEDSLLFAARVAAGESRHEDAIAIYERVVRDNPARLWDVSAPLAFQYAWAGRLEEARREFHRALVLDPVDFEVRLGELLVLNWMGLHRTAWEGYVHLHRLRRDLAEPLVGLASAQNWSGDRESSLATLKVARITDPGNRDAELLEASIREQLRARGGVYGDGIDDADGFRVAGLWAETSWHPDPSWDVTAFLNRLSLELPGADDAEETWTGLRFEGRTSPDWVVWGRAVYLVDRPDEADYTPLVGDLSVQRRFGDTMRWTGGFERFALTSPVTAPDKITGTGWSVAADVYPDWRTHARARVQRSTYSDDNTRWNLEAEASRRIQDSWRVRVGARARLFTFAHDRDNGIWTPDSFRGLAATGSFEVGPRDRWSVSGGLEAGPSHQGGEGTDVYAAVRLGAFYRWGRATLEADVSRAEGAFDGWRGESRTTSHLGVRVRF